MTTKKGRGRPRQFDRDRAIRTARHLFHTKGYDGVGVAELGSAMGVNPPSLYAAFGSKRRLYELALEDYVANEGGWIAGIVARDDPLPDVIAMLFSEAATRYVRNRGTPGCMVLNGVRGSTDKDVCELSRKRSAGTRKLILACIKRDEPQVAERLTDFVMVILHGLSVGAGAGWSRPVMNRAAETAAAGFAAQVTRAT